MKRRSWSERCALLLSVVLATAHAQADVDDAEALVDNGLELRRLHKNAEALAAFREAYAQRPTPRIRAQIALAEQALGEWLAAEKDLDAALASTDDPWIEKHRPVLEEARAKIGAHLGEIELSVDTNGVDAYLDGVSLGTTPRPGPIRVVAGVHRVEIRRKGGEPVGREVTVAAGGKVRVEIALPKPVAKTSPPAPTPEQPPSVTLPLVLLGSGVVAIGAGTWLGVRTFALKSERDRHCGDLYCDDEGVRLDGAARTSATWSTVSFAAGAALGALGTVLLVRTRSVHVGVSPHPSNVALTVGGVW